MVSDVEALRTIEELERLHGYRIDAILPSGKHRYCSTHCRHDTGDGRGHRACAAEMLVGRDAESIGSPHTWDAAVVRNPAQCKTCAAPCVCSCHRGESQP